MRTLQIQSQFNVELLRYVISQFGRVALIMLVHKKPNRLQPHIAPLFNAVYPFVNTYIIGRVQAITYKANKCMWRWQFHMHTISAAGSIGNYCAYVEFFQQVKYIIPVFGYGKPILMAQL